LPLAYFTYSAWMSRARVIATDAIRLAKPSTAVATTPPAGQPPGRLRGIADPPDRGARVVGHEQGAIGQNQQPHRASPAGAVGQLPADDKVLDRHRDAVADVHADHFRPRRHRAIPRAV